MNMMISLGWQNLPCEKYSHELHELPRKAFVVIRVIRGKKNSWCIKELPLRKDDNSNCIYIRYHHNTPELLFTMQNTDLFVNSCLASGNQ